MSDRTRSARYLGPARPAQKPLPDKVASAEAAAADIRDGDVLLVGGVNSSTFPDTLLSALLKTRANDLTIVCLNAENEWIARLLVEERCRRLLTATAGVRTLASAGAAAVEIFAPGLLLEQIRAAGAGLGGVLAPPELAGDAELGRAAVGDQEFAIAPALLGNVALVKAWRGDRFGNLAYRGSYAGASPVMATAAPLVLAEVAELYETGDLDPGAVMTPGITVRSVVLAG